MSVEERIADTLERLDPYQTLNREHALQQAREILALEVEGWKVDAKYEQSASGAIYLEGNPATLQDLIDEKAVKG